MVTFVSFVLTGVMQKFYVYSVSQLVSVRGAPTNIFNERSQKKKNCQTCKQKCCTFLPKFGCSALQTLVQISFIQREEVNRGGIVMLQETHVKDENLMVTCALAGPFLPLNWEL